MGFPLYNTQVSINELERSVNVLTFFVDHLIYNGSSYNRSRSDDLGYHAHTDLPFIYFALQEQMRDLLLGIKIGVNESEWDYLFSRVCQCLRECLSQDQFQNNPSNFYRYRGSRWRYGILRTNRYY